MSLIRVSDFGFICPDSFQYANLISSGRSSITLRNGTQVSTFPCHNSVGTSLITGLGDTVVSFLDNKLIINKSLLNQQTFIGQYQVNSSLHAQFYDKAGVSFSINVGHENWSRLMNEFEAYMRGYSTPTETALMTVNYKGKWSTLYKTQVSSNKSEITNAVEIRLSQHDTVISFNPDFLKRVDEIHAEGGKIAVYDIDNTDYKDIHVEGDCEAMLQDFLLAMYDHDFIFGQRKQDLAALYYSDKNKVMRVYLKSDSNNVYPISVPITCQSDYACRWFKKLHEQECLLTDRLYFINIDVMKQCNAKVEFIDWALMIDGEEFKTDKLDHTHAFLSDLLQMLKRQ